MSSSPRYGVSLWFYELALSLRRLSEEDDDLKKVAAKVRSRLRSIVEYYDESPYDAMMFLISKTNLGFLEDHVIDLMQRQEEVEFKDYFESIKDYKDYTSDNLAFTIIMAVIFKAFESGGYGSFTEKEDVARGLKDLLAELSSKNVFLEDLLEDTLVDAKRISEALLPSSGEEV